MRAVRGTAVAGLRQVLELDALPSSNAELGPWRIELLAWQPDPAQPARDAVPLVMSGAPLSPSASEHVLLLVREEAELGALRQRLEQVNRTESLGLLAGGIAHDFNNLLTGIRGSLAMARHHTSAEVRASALNAADTAAQRAGEVTRRLLTFGRGPDRVSGRAEPLSVLQETVDLLRCIPDSTGVNLDVESELGVVEMLPSDLHQVVLNLLINASDAVRSTGEADHITLRATTTHRTRPGGIGGSVKWLRVSVIDHGPGMDADVRERIFEPFFSTKIRGNGTGLGLSSVKDLVERAGGWLEVESEPTKGSAFHVYLPLSGEYQPAAVTLVPQSSVVRATPAVLICDDEGRLGDLTVGLLQEFGYKSTAVLRGEEALAVLAAPSAPRVLLLDVNLSGGMSASEVLHTLSSKSLPVAVILTSGLSAEDQPAELLNHPLVVNYLAKPYTVGELVGAISAATGIEPSTDVNLDRG